MTENLFVIALATFSIMLIPAFISYRIALRKKRWWLYSWTGHSLAFSLLFFILYFNSLPVDWLGIIAATCLIVSGLGLLLLSLGYFIEHGHARKDEYIKWHIVLPTHAFMFAVALSILRTVEMSAADLMLSYAFLFLYFLLMRDKLDVPWILYEGSAIPNKKRISYIHRALAILYVSIPLLTFIYS